MTDNQSQGTPEAPVGQTAPQQQAAAPGPRKSQGVGKGVVIATAVLGGLALLGVLGSVALANMPSFASGSEQRSTANAHDIDALDIDAGSANFTVVFDEEAGSDARLEVRESTREWRLERRGTTLQVESVSPFGLSWLSFGPRPQQQVVLHLPAGLQEDRLDLDVDLSSGSFDIDADFGDIDADLSSGVMSITGSVDMFESRVSSGRVNFDLADVRFADIEVSSGNVRGELSGDAPQEFELSVSSGAVDISLPDEVYAVESRVSSGRFDNQLRTDPSSRNVVDVSVSSGKVSLRGDAEGARAQR